MGEALALRTRVHHLKVSVSKLCLQEGGALLPLFSYLFQA